jgi:transposase InsO family protein
VKEMVVGMPLLDRVEEFYDGCALAKQRRYSFLHVAGYCGSHNLDLVNADLCGQIKSKTLGGKNYFLLIVDDHNRYIRVEFLATKDEAFKCFKCVKVLAQTESGSKLRAFRSDRGEEFNSIEFQEFCDEHGIKQFTTTPYTPQQNGVVERRNRTVVEMARCLLKSKKMVGEFWGEVVSTAVHILNRAPSV